MNENNIGCSGLLFIAAAFIVAILFIPAGLNEINGESLNGEIKEQLEELKGEFVFKENRRFEVKDKSIITQTFPFHAFNTLSMVILKIKDENGDVS